MQFIHSIIAVVIVTHGVVLRFKEFYKHQLMFLVCVTGAEVEHGIAGGPTTAVTPVAAAVGGPQV